MHQFVSSFTCSDFVIKLFNMIYKDKVWVVSENISVVNVRLYDT